MYVRIDQENITMSHDIMIDILASAVQKGHSLPPDCGAGDYREIAENALAIMMKTYLEMAKEEQN